jgi:hypothetical protein
MFFDLLVAVLLAWLLLIGVVMGVCLLLFSFATQP